MDSNVHLQFDILYGMFCSWTQESTCSGLNHQLSKSICLVLLLGYAYQTAILYGADQIEILLHV